MRDQEASQEASQGPEPESHSLAEMPEVDMTGTRRGYYADKVQRGQSPDVLESQRETIERTAAEFKDLVVAYIQSDPTDPSRPSWEQVDAAQQAFLEATGLKGSEHVIRRPEF